MLGGKGRDSALSRLQLRADAVGEAVDHAWVLGELNIEPLSMDLFAHAFSAMAAGASRRAATAHGSQAAVSIVIRHPLSSAAIGATPR